MQLATLSNGTRDGRLVVISRDHTMVAPADRIAETLQEALDRWVVVETALHDLADRLEAGHVRTAFPFVAELAMAPLPRAWQWLDGSAYPSHSDLMQKVFRMNPVPRESPLMYQGLSDRFYGPYDDIPFIREEDSIDFEGEFGVIVDDVPMGASVDEAAGHIRLIVQINDWSLRKIAPIEMKTGFGWIQAKPPSSMAPVAVTPDELGESWRDGRVDLTLFVDWNGKRFGAASGYHMSSSFSELIAHAAHTRPLCAGTIIGSGTVSNENFRQVGSSCIAERRGIELLDTGAPTTDFMHFGDRVRMEARRQDNLPLFGAIDQRVVQAVTS